MLVKVLRSLLHIQKFGEDIVVLTTKKIFIENMKNSGLL